MYVVRALYIFVRTIVNIVRSVHCGGALEETGSCGLDRDVLMSQRTGSKLVLFLINELAEKLCLLQALESRNACFVFARSWLVLSFKQ